MEKQHSKPKNKFLKLLPKAASAVSFQNPQFSPGRDKRSDNTNKIKAHVGKGFSGPIVSIIPDEARRKTKNESFQEPTSPKVSCMGQIKHKKKKINKAKRVSPPQDITKPVSSSTSDQVKKHASKFKKIFSGVKQGRSKSDDIKEPLPDRAPPLSQMKRFASGRDSFANFDWSAQIAPIESDDRNYYSDEERGGDSDQEEDEVIIPFSAPMTLGGGVALQPRKEVNLWKRRTITTTKSIYGVKNNCL